jgi:small subunit ribosomal protein S6
MSEQRTRQYEAMFLLGQNAAADQTNAINLCRSIIERHQGQIMVIKRWDERKLAYELKGQKRGTYVIAYFKAPTSQIAAMERDVKLSEEVLRVLITDADHLNQQEMEAVEPQPIEKREERPSWDMPPMGGFGGDRGDRGPRGPRGPRREEGEPAGAGKE